jgi:hypothetical protein
MLPGGANRFRPGVAPAELQRLFTAAYFNGYVSGIAMTMCHYRAKGEFAYPFWPWSAWCLHSRPSSLKPVCTTARESHAFTVNSTVLADGYVGRTTTHAYSRGTVQLCSLRSRLEIRQAAAIDPGEVFLGNPASQVTALTNLPRRVEDRAVSGTLPLGSFGPSTASENGNGHHRKQNAPDSI